MECGFQSPAENQSAGTAGSPTTREMRARWAPADLLGPFPPSRPVGQQSKQGIDDARKLCTGCPLLPWDQNKQERQTEGQQPLHTDRGGLGPGEADPPEGPSCAQIPGLGVRCGVLCP